MKAEAEAMRASVLRAAERLYEAESEAAKEAVHRRETARVLVQKLKSGVAYGELPCPQTEEIGKAPRLAAAVNAMILVAYDFERGDI
jgi:hypothetical protein